MQKWLSVAAGLCGGSVAILATPAVPEFITARPLQDPAAQQRPTEIRASLNNPGSHPRIGVQDFAASGASAGLADAARVVADVLLADLDYEREFYMIPRKSSAGIPFAATPSALPFSRWSEIGADFVLMGSATESGGRMAVEIRLVHVRGSQPGTQEFGQSYDGCTVANPRFCAHSIADDMHKRLRNLDGIARTRIAFTSDRDAARMTSRLVEDSGQGKEIYIMDYDGANQRRITVNQSLNLGPSWGPDGRTLAYASYASRYPDVYLATLDGRPPTRPAQGNEIVQNTSPAVSPDGTQIAYTSNRGTPGYFDVWVVNRDGSNPRNLTPGSPRSSEGAATWSPGGNQIALTSDRTGTNQVFIMNADGTNLSRLTFDQQADRPTWSRMNYIAYTLRQPSGHDIALIDLSNRTPRVLTDGQGSNRQPTVSSNGRHIVFVTTRWGKEHLASIDSDGKNIRRLTEVGNNTYPNWSPAPSGR